ASSPFARPIDPELRGARDFSARASTANMCRDWALALGLAISVSNRARRSVVQLGLPIGLEDEGVVLGPKGPARRVAIWCRFGRRRSLAGQRRGRAGP